MGTKLRTIYAIAGCVIALTGCSQHSLDPADAAYVEVAHTVFPDASSDALFKTRQQLCDLLDKSPTRETAHTAATATMRSGLTPTEVGAFMGAAVRSGCPQHFDLFN